MRAVGCGLSEVGMVLRGAGRGLLAAVALAASADAQRAPAADTTVACAARSWRVQGDARDTYERALQTLDTTDRRLWSLRSTERESRCASARWSAHASARTLYNSLRPFGLHEGPVWAGVGATAAVDAGFAWARGPLRVRFAPVAFWAQNAAFAGADTLSPVNIDRPDRFGGGSYARIEPGETEVRLAAWGAAAGVSTAVEVWGPARTHALLLGPHAGGVPRLFAGTDRPANVGIGRLHGRVVLGRLEQSAYTDIPGDSARRLAAGIVVVFQPHGLDGLEVGGARFFDRVYDGGFRAGDLLIPFEGLLKSRLRDKDDPTRSAPDNQLASVFFRWATRGAGFEVYGEYARDDHNADLRDLALEPDHISAYTLGVQRSWRRGEAVSVFGAEVLNARPTHLGRVRGQAPWYVNTVVRQGHTQRGLVLGSPAAPGGGGFVLAWDQLSPSARWGVRWDRVARGLRTGETADATSETLDAVTVEVARWLGGREVWVAGGPVLASRLGATAAGLHLRAGTRLARAPAS